MTIDEKTKITLYSVIGGSGVLVFAVAFIVSLAGDVKAGKEFDDRVRVRMKEDREILVQIQQDVAVLLALAKKEK